MRAKKKIEPLRKRSIPSLIGKCCPEKGKNNFFFLYWKISTKIVREGLYLNYAQNRGEKK